MRAILLIVFLFAFTVNTVAEEPVERLKTWLDANPLTQETALRLAEQPFARQALSKAQSTQASEVLWQARKQTLAKQRRAEHDARLIKMGDLEMPFWYRVFGEPNQQGRSLYISMHGGGGAPARVNDGQYENQKRLYQPKEGVYLVPRAPTDTWNLWHQTHIDQFFDRLITNMVVFEGVDPNRVYLMGYSAGGDGVYQLAPRMADRFAAASMMAGHPNETKPDGLRNLPFAIFMGGRDSAYRRNQIAAEWKTKLGDLQQNDEEGYTHSVTIFDEMGHWMQRKDAVALAWMSEFQRKQFPRKVIWLQDDVTHRQFYWLKVKQPKQRERVEVVRDGNTVRLVQRPSSLLSVLLSDEMMDLDQPVVLEKPDGTSREVMAERRIRSLVETLLERDDPEMMFPVILEAGE